MVLVCQVNRVEKVGGVSSRGENSYGIEIFCKVCNVVSILSNYSVIRNKNTYAIVF